MGWLHTKGARTATYVALPLARSDELIVEEVDAEVLIYDQRIDEAHCLNPAAGAVWRACDGRTSREQLGARLGLDESTVERALDELERCGLLDVPTRDGVTRRQAAVRFAKVGTAAAAAPLIYSIIGPLPEAAASVTAAFCAQFSGANCGTNGAGCSAQAGCCCYHFNAGTVPPALCNGNNQHCCLTPAAGCAAGGSNSACGPNTTSPC